MSSSNTTIASLEAMMTQTHTDMDTLWVLVCTMMVFLMQTGFSFLEAGSVRSTSVVNILTKNLIGTCMVAICWWILGYGLAFGDDTTSGTRNGFIGNADFVTAWSSYKSWHIWVFEWAFVADTTTILSGAIAERTTTHGYLIYAAIFSGWIYPVVAHWFWSTAGWLSPFKKDIEGPGSLGVIDFAGCAVVHLLGGVASLCGAVIMGPRKGRWVPENEKFFRPHNIPYQFLGTLLLFLGWFGFNPGSTTAISNGMSIVAAKATVNTVLAAAAAGLTGAFIRLCIPKFLVWDSGNIQNCVLAGLVAVTAGCATVEPWGAVCIGIIAAPIYIGLSHLLRFLKIDDPLDAVPVHGGCGLWGLIAAGIFSSPRGVSAAYNVVSTGSLFWGNGEQFGMQFLGAVVVIAWGAAWCIPLFIILRFIPKGFGFRVSEKQEKSGMDHALHDVDGYANITQEDLDETFKNWVEFVEFQKKKKSEDKASKTASAEPKSEPKTVEPSSTPQEKPVETNDIELKETPKPVQETPVATQEPTTSTTDVTNELKENITAENINVDTPQINV